MTLGKAVFGNNKKGGMGVFFSKKIRGPKSFFQLKKGGRRLFFRKNKGGEDFFFRQIFPKTRSRYPVNFDRSVSLKNVFSSLFRRKKSPLIYYFKKYSAFFFVSPKIFPCYENHFADRTYLLCQ